MGINAGIYFARVDFFRQIGPGRKTSIEQELFPGWAKAGHLRAFPTEGRFIDIGIPASYAEAQLFFRPKYNIEIPTMEELRRSGPVVAQMLAARKPDEIKDWKLAVGVIIRDNHGRILLERRTDCGLWGLVGGRIDLGETPDEAAKREVKEETGLDIAIERLVGFYSDPKRDVMSYSNGDIVQTAALVLEASVAGGEFSPSHESLELAYFEPCAIPRMAIPITLEALDDCLSGRAPALR
jgi:ADP-ribose pyrophosphatase YjhB (NUDIX family)